MKKYSWVFLLSFVLLTASCGNEGSESNEQNKEQVAVSEQNLSDAEYVKRATFTDLQGNKVSISDFEGKVVLIDFWETWCRPCLASFPTMQKLQEKYPDSFVVLAVTPGFTDTKQDARSFAENHDYTFTYLMDSNNLHQKLGVQGIPYKVYVDTKGNLIKKSMGTAGPEGDYKTAKQIIEKHKKS